MPGNHGHRTSAGVSQQRCPRDPAVPARGHEFEALTAVGALGSPLAAVHCPAGLSGLAAAFGHCRTAPVRQPRRPITLWVRGHSGEPPTLAAPVGRAIGQRLGQRIVIENGRCGRHAGHAGVGPGRARWLHAGADAADCVPRPRTHKLAWDPIRDTTPVIQVSGVTFGMVVPTDSPLTSVEAMLQWARTALAS